MLIYVGVSRWRLHETAECVRIAILGAPAPPSAEELGDALKMLIWALRAAEYKTRTAISGAPAPRRRENCIH
eukprot:3171308-Pyramimonas_sp.AAC.1